jgi:hypothetical protein
MKTVSYDFGLVERAIDAIQQRNTIRAKASARALWLPKLGWAAVGIGLGIAIAAVGLSGLRAEPVGGGWRHAIPSSAPKSQSGVGTSENISGEVITDYVIFHSVSLEKGVVVTGWHYGSELQSTPDRQWCYLDQPEPDGIRKVTPEEMMHEADRAECQWFEGEHS